MQSGEVSVEWDDELSDYLMSVGFPTGVIREFLTARAPGTIGIIFCAITWLSEYRNHLRASQDIATVPRTPQAEEELLVSALRDKLIRLIPNRPVVPPLRVVTGSA